MGNFLASMLSSNNYPEVFIDFENAKPNDSEAKLFGAIADLLERGEALITEISEYKGCQALQREAMMNRSADAEEKCFEALLESVAGINRFHTYSKDLQDQLPDLFVAVCTLSSDGKESIGDKQALATLVARSLSFALRFDQQRMKTAAISNDFSYYRRLLPKFSNRDDMNIIVGDDLASVMAMFTAEYQPMMKALTAAGGEACKQCPHVTAGLGILANSCRMMIDTKRYQNEATNYLCARAMTGALVLYDRVDDEKKGFGVFHKRSPVAVRAIVQCLKRNFPQEVSLLSNIQFSTSTFRTAPSSIQSLF